MSAASRGIKLSGINVKSFLLSGLVIIVVVALFLVPEIASFQSAKVNRLISFDSKKSEHEESAAAHKRADSREADLQSVENLVQESAQRAASRKSGSELALPQEGAGSAAGPVSAELAHLETLLDVDGSQEMRARRVIEADNKQREKNGTAPKTEHVQSKVTWETLRSGDSRSAIKQAANEAIAIAEALPQSKRASRYALFNFASATNFVMGKASDSLTPEEAGRFLEISRQSALSAMQREDVGSAQYNRFVSLNLGPVIESYRTMRAEAERLPFNPRLMIYAVEVTKAGDRKGRYLEQSPVYFKAIGSVVGNDVKNIEVLRNGRLVWRGKPRPTDPNGYRNFYTPRLGAKGIITVRAFDRFGQFVENHYNFFPRVTKLRWSWGKFQIPYFGVEDHRINNFFLFRQSNAAGGSRNFFDDSQFQRF